MGGDSPGMQGAINHFNRRSRLAMRPLMLGFCLVSLLQCAGGYQAPVREQGEKQVIEPPIIVSSDGSTRVATLNLITPAPVASGATARPPVTSGSMYRVRRGDTLYSIAFQYDLDFRSLAIANNLSPPYTIYVDQELSLDVNNPSSARASRETASTPTGTVVNNNAVASARAANSTSNTVIRQTLSPANNAEPQWKWPLQGRVLAGFQSVSTNKGIDIGGRTGEPVLAAADGDVVYAGNTIQGSGNLIIIRHNDRYLSAYAQNRSLLVAQGDRVRTGETIAEVGQPAGAEPRLHFEIRLDGKPVDPLRYLPRQ